MKEFFHQTGTNSLRPIMIKNNGQIYWTLYDDFCTDSLLHNEKNILYFLTREDLDQFCEKNSFETDKDIGKYDFDARIQNPIHYGHILEHWNLLNTIAKDLRMYFEGDCKKYNTLYDLLFRLNLPMEPIPPTYTVSEKHYKYILKVFRKKDRFFNRFQLYQEK